MSPHAASPQAAMRSYAQLCGIATALDVIGDRWTLLVVRDLLLGPLRFSDLAEGLPGIGTNTLTTRLKALEVTGVVHRQLLPLPERGTVYELTTYGRELEPILLALGRWGTRSMGTLPPDVTTRSRWLVAAMLAFHDDSQRSPSDHLGAAADRRRVHGARQGHEAHRQRRARPSGPTSSSPPRTTSCTGC